MPSNLERKARRKQQTKLVFEPSSSSPAPAPEQVNMRSPAKVRYSLRGEKRRDYRGSGVSGKGVGKGEVQMKLKGGNGKVGDVVGLSVGMS